MIKNISTLLILFSTIINYGQNFTLIKNKHPKAKELIHHLNSTRDSLMLECEAKILKVDIFNEDYEKVVTVEDFKIQISLKDVPVGKFVIEAKLIDKIIVMDLIRQNTICKASLTKNETAEGKGMMLDESLNVISKSPNKSIEFILTGVKAKKQITKKQRFYWVLTKVNNESGSSKTMRLLNKVYVDRLILKHKQELNSVSGKLNKLTVWEVYNTTKFMEHQMLNPDFFYSLHSDLFNTTPYYATENTVQNI